MRRHQPRSGTACLDCLRLRLRLDDQRRFGPKPAGVVASAAVVEEDWHYGRGLPRANDQDYRAGSG